MIKCAFEDCDNEARYVNMNGALCCGTCPVKHGIDSVRITDVHKIAAWIRDVVSEGTVTVDAFDEITALIGTWPPPRGALPWGESKFRQLYSNYRLVAKRRGLVFELSELEFQQITSKACTYCGLKPSQRKESVESFGPYIYNGIDRVDSSIGYVPDNCVSCCKECNKAKSNRTREAFEAWLARVIAFRAGPCACGATHHEGR